jgi:hypothetical protein
MEWAPGQMSFMLAIVTSLPSWAVLTLGFGLPVLGAVTALLGQYLGRRATWELEDRSKREEVMRILRWAAELAVSNDAGKSRLGLQELEALRDSKLLTSVEQGFIDAALKATIEIPRQAIDQSAEDVNVVLEADANDGGETPVPSEEGEQGEEADI